MQLCIAACSWCREIIHSKVLLSDLQLELIQFNTSSSRSWRQGLVMAAVVFYRAWAAIWDRSRKAHAFTSCTTYWRWWTIGHINLVKMLGKCKNMETSSWLVSYKMTMWSSAICGRDGPTSASSIYSSSPQSPQEWIFFKISCTNYLLKSDSTSSCLNILLVCHSFV